MRYAIDISQIVYGTGVSTYTKNLVANLLNIDREDEFVLFAGVLRRKQEILSMFPQTKIFPIPPTIADLIWNRIHKLPIEKLIGEVDVLHTSDWTEPPSRAFKVTTVHDLSPFLYPNLFPRDRIRDIVNTQKRKMGWVKNETDRIIVPTNSTKMDLVKLGFDEAKIRVIPEAPAQIFKRADNDKITTVKSKYKIFGDYVFSIGMDPRKNTERLIKAFEHSSPGKNIKLVFAGTLKYVKVKETRNVRVLGRISDEDLVALYSGARAFLYPSLYEGFGLPILEAFACGTPVVTSNSSSMAEVALGAAELVDPTKVDSITEGLNNVLRGPKGYIERGLKVVKNYSWEKTAKETLKVYKEAQK